MALLPRLFPRVVEQREQALTASAQRIKGIDTPMGKRLAQPWQRRAFDYYDLLGEIWYASQFFAQGLSKVRLFIATQDDDGGYDEVDTPQAREILDSIGHNAQGGWPTLLATYGRLQFLVGDALLLVSQEDSEQRWEFCSTDELRVVGGYIERLAVPGGQASRRYKDAGVGAAEGGSNEDQPTVDGEAVLYRFWRRHPRFSQWSDSPMRAVLDLCEELLMLTYAIRGQARSRISRSGILLVPNDAPSIPMGPGGNPSAPSRFIEDLTEHMMTPIRDEGVAASMVPMIVEWNPDTIDKWLHMTFMDADQQVYPEAKLRMETIQRIAMGLDMPPEVLLGVTDANHWTAWQIGEDAWKAHLQPVVQSLANDLTEVLRTLPEWGDDWCIWFDESEVVNRPDRTQPALDLHDRFAISDEALRREAGFDESDAIEDEEEFVKRVGLKMNDPELAVTGDPEAAMPAPVPPQLQGQNPPPPAEPDPAEAPPTRPGPPEQQAARVIERELAVICAELASLAIERCREKAGARIRSRVQRRADHGIDPTAVRQLERVDDRLVCATLGEVLVRQLGPGYEPTTLVAGACSPLSACLGRLGFDLGAQRDAVAHIEAAAAESLFEVEPGTAEVAGRWALLTT